MWQNVDGLQIFRRKVHDGEMRERRLIRPGEEPAVPLRPDAADAQVFGQHPKMRDGQKARDRRGRFPETILHFLLQIGELLFRVQRGQTSIELDLHFRFLAVGVIDVRVVRKFNPCVGQRARRRLSFLLALQFFHGVIQHRAIRRKADRRDISVLRRAEQIPRPADFQIPHRYFETGAQVREFANRIQTLLRRFRQHFSAPIEEIRARNLIRASHAPAHLIELRKPHPVRVVDNHRIRIRLIDPVFHNRRAKEHVILPTEKIVHDPLERIPRHPSVRDADYDLRRQQRPQMIGHRLDRLDAIENEIHLPAAFLFAQNRFFHDRVVVLRHIRLDGVAIRRRLRQRRHVAQPCQTHVERPRNRRRRKRQDIDPRLPRFPFFLLRHAETLLFVHDQNPQMPTLDPFRQNRVRPD